MSDTESDLSQDGEDASFLDNLASQLSLADSAPADNPFKTNAQLSAVQGGEHGSSLEQDEDEPVYADEEEDAEQQQSVRALDALVEDPLSSAPTQSASGFSWQGFDQLKVLQDENAQLMMLLDEKEERIDELKDKLESALSEPSEMREVPASIKEAATKLQALSRKNRELQATVNAQQTKTKKLTKKIGELEYSVLGLEREASKQKRVEAKLRKQLEDAAEGLAPPPELSPKPKEKERDESTSAYRNEIQNLKRQLQHAHVALEKELGESTPVSLVLSAESQWVGRAQQITMLKAKVAELQSQVRSGSRADSVASVRSLSSTRNGAADRTKAMLKKMEDKKKADVESALQRAEEAVDKYEGLQKKYDALKARNKVLSSEAKQLRGEVTEYREKEETLSNALDHSQARAAELEASVAALKKRPHKPRIETAKNDGATLEALENLTKLCQQQAAEIRSLKQSTPQAGTAFLTDVRGSRPSSRHTRSAGLAELSRPSSGFRRHASMEAPKQLDEAALAASVAIERDRLKELTVVLRNEMAAQQEQYTHMQAQLNTFKRRASPHTTHDDHESLRLALDDTQAQVHRHRKEAELRSSEVAVLHKAIADMRRIFSEAVKKFKASS